MKEDWRKTEKALYAPGKTPGLVDVPAQRFIAIDGVGDPNGDDFSDRVGVLYALSYTIKMMPKSGVTPEGYEEYSMFPLEGVWDLQGPWLAGTPLDKSALKYTIMIRQPAFVTDALFAFAQETAIKKKKLPLLGEAALITMTDGLSVQMLHIGPYDDEPASFALMDAFAQDNGLNRIETAHREIYMGDPRKGAPEKRRTILRYRVAQA